MCSEVYKKNVHIYQSMLQSQLKTCKKNLYFYSEVSKYISLLVTNCKTQPLASIGWVALSSIVLSFIFLSFIFCTLGVSLFPSKRLGWGSPSAPYTSNNPFIGVERNRKANLLVISETWWITYSGIILLLFNWSFLAEIAHWIDFVCFCVSAGFMSECLVLSEINVQKKESQYRHYQNFSPT